MTTTPAEELIHVIGNLRKRVAPPGSYRERVLRGIYVPLLLKLKRRALARVEPNAVCEILPGEAMPGKRLPSAPRILILKLDHIGDFVVSMQAMQHLRDHFPDAHITLACGGWSRDWASRIGLFDEIVTYDGMKRTSAVWGGFSPALVAAFDALALGRYDLAIDLRHDPDTRLLLDRVDATFHAGYSAPMDKGGAGLDISLPDVEHISVAEGSGRPLMAEQRLMLLASAVTNVFATSFSRQSHPAHRLVPEPAPQRSDRAYAIVAPGAGGDIRLWNADRLEAVAAWLLTSYDLDLVVTGTDPERATAERFLEIFPEGRVRSAIGTRLADLPLLMQGAALYLGYDTGPTHMAAALGVPTVSVMSGIPNADVWRTLGEHVVVVRGRTDCSPCHLMEAIQCPHGVACLDIIRAEDVVAACRMLLGHEDSQAGGRVAREPAIGERRQHSIA